MRPIIHVLLGVMIAVGVVAAADQASPHSKPMLLGAEDQLTIRVSDFDDIPDRPLPIDSSGFLDLPVLGRIQATGLTVSQLEAQIAERARRYVKEPRVSVSVTTVSSQPVSVLGAVNKPGVYQLSGPKTLIEVLSLAGGLRQDAGSVLRITRESVYGNLNLPGKRIDLTQKYEVADIDLDDLMKAKIPAGNVMVEAHDVVTVPKADLIYVVGRVRRPGGFPIQAHEQLGLLQGLALAEGLDANAAPRHARILREAADGKQKVEIPVDIKAVLEGKGANVSLQANDVLFIPSDTAKSIGLRAAEIGLQLGTGLAIYRR